MKKKARIIKCEDYGREYYLIQYKFLFFTIESVTEYPTLEDAEKMIFAENNGKVISPIVAEYEII